jgi:hypothetical protein
MKNVWIAALLLFAVSCGDDKPNEIRLRINHYLEPGIAEGTFLFMLTQEDASIGTDKWNYLSTIEGFQYEKGYIYDLVVSKENVKNPPVDASSIRYKLMKVIAKKKVPDEVTFQVRLSRVYSANAYESFVTGSATAGFKLLNEIEIRCENLCDDLSGNLNNHQPMIGIFKHDGASIKLAELMIEK